MSNVVSLKAFRTEKECERLFSGYKARIATFTKEEMSAEISRFQQEMKRYPNHLLTLVKGKILLQTLLARGSKNEAIQRLLQDIETRFAKLREVEYDGQARAQV